jgi:hypothetical protein
LKLRWRWWRPWVDGEGDLSSRISRARIRGDEARKAVVAAMG